MHSATGGWRCRWGSRCRQAAAAMTQRCRSGAAALHLQPALECWPASLSLRWRCRGGGRPAVALPAHLEALLGAFTVPSPVRSGLLRRCQPAGGPPATAAPARAAGRGGSSRLHSAQPGCPPTPQSCRQALAGRQAGGGRAGRRCACRSCQRGVRLSPGHGARKLLRAERSPTEVQGTCSCRQPPAHPPTRPPTHPPTHLRRVPSAARLSFSSHTCREITGRENSICGRESRQAGRQPANRWAGNQERSGHAAHRLRRGPPQHRCDCGLPHRHSLYTSVILPLPALYLSPFTATCAWGGARHQRCSAPRTAP